jgi:hypothetical protein
VSSLGRWVRPMDPRSRDYAYTSRVIRPRSVSHGAYARITDQDGVGACVGFTCLDIINTSKFLHSRYQVNRSSTYLGNDRGFDFYGLATGLDKWPQTWPPEDTGSSILAGAKVLKQLGFIERYEWALTFESFLVALQHQPVMVGTLWTNGMSDPDATGLVRPTGGLAGGHAYMVRGVNFVSRKLRCRNHWTSQWGRDGEFYIGFDDMEWLLSQQGDCVVPIPLQQQNLRKRQR